MWVKASAGRPLHIAPMTHAGMDNKTLFVIGSTGLLGDAVVREAIRQGMEVFALVRNLASRRDALSRRWPGVQFVEGDVAQPLLGISADDQARLRDVAFVVDAFGRFAFGMSEDEARLNVDGALEAIRFAATLPKLNAYAHVGGYRVAIEPNPKDLDGAYERSKRLAVREVAEEAKKLAVPLTQLHPASVLGDSRTGETSQTMGLGEMVRELFRKRMPALVGPKESWVPITFSDDFARLALAALDDRALGSETTAHWILDEDTPKLKELVARIAAILGVTAPTRHLSKALVRALPRSLTRVEPETLGFLDDQTYPTASLRALRDRYQIAPPNLDEALPRWVAHLVATDFLTTARRGRFVEQTFVGKLGDERGERDLVLLHGLPLEHESFAEMVQALGKNAWAPDLPGLGRSGPGDVNGAWLSQLLDGLGLREAVLVAHSYGCLPALELASWSPERVRGLVLISPFFLQPRPSPVFRCAMMTSLSFRLASPAQLERALFKRQTPVTVRTHKALRRPGAAKTSARLLASASGRSERARLRGLLEHLDVPYCIVCGESDPSDSDHRVIADAGHAPQVDAPEHVALELSRFLRSLERGSTSANQTSGAEDQAARRSAAGVGL